MPAGTLAPPTSRDAARSVADDIDQELWKKKSFWQLFNISIGFLGIQFAWAIQMGQMSPLLESLGSDPRLLGLISCAGPVTGVLVQPIVGALSDKCGLKMGRRRPFLLAGAVMTAIALLLMPNSVQVAEFINSLLPGAAVSVSVAGAAGSFQMVQPLLIAAILLWVLDASINLTQGPYRALVPDVVHKSQQASAYSMMSFTIGLGSVAAFLIGFYISSIHNLFYLGASAMLIAMVWTSFTTPEPDPGSLKDEDGDEPRENFFVSTAKSIVSMPKEGLKLCAAHSFTWFGLMCLFVFFSIYVPHHVFGAHAATEPAYQEGVKWASLCYAVLNAVCFVFSMFIGKLCDVTSKKAVHSFGLFCMGLSFFSLFFITEPWQAMVAMGLIGIGWATTLSIPFALLSEHLPQGKEGVMMGTFNIFIAAPGVVSSLLVGQIVSVFGNNVAVAMIVGGISMLISMGLLQLVKETRAEAPVPIAVPDEPMPVAGA